MRLDHNGIISLNELSHDASRVDFELSSLHNTAILDNYNVPQPDGRALQLKCDTLNNMLADHSEHIKETEGNWCRN
jgi:hypothetical protein